MRDRITTPGLRSAGWDPAARRTKARPRRLTKQHVGFGVGGTPWPHALADFEQKSTIRQKHHEELQLRTRLKLHALGRRVASRIAVSPPPSSRPAAACVAATPAPFRRSCRFDFGKRGRAKPSVSDVVVVFIPLGPMSAHGRDGSSRVTRSNLLACNRHNLALTGRSGTSAVSAATFSVEACACCIAALRRL